MSENQPRPSLSREYVNMIMDSRRWAHFEPRDGDIIVCTPYKSGTTWTQMICALLIFQSSKFPMALGDLSPWLDLKIESIEKIAATYNAQSHRRIIKTHTPLDGIPFFENVSYVYCARDPRDIFMSMQGHGENQNMEVLIEKIAAQGNEIPPPQELPDDVNERFELWLTKPAYPWEEDGYPYWSVFSHLKTFWPFRNFSNIHFLHFADLKTDLAGQMRRLAKLLAVEVDEALFPGLVEAATFRSMKANADSIAPEASHQVWKSNASFFNSGENEQWREVFSADNLALYDKTRDNRTPGEMGRWLERGFIDTGLAYF
ncbi:MAG: sulfotransferase domain-containing protein [Pseudomonadota bacterium]